jgi:hypothetical protein
MPGLSREALEGLEPAGKVLGGDEIGQVAAKLIVGFIVVALNGRLVCDLLWLRRRQQQYPGLRCRAAAVKGDVHACPATAGNPGRFPVLSMVGANCVAFGCSGFNDQIMLVPRTRSRRLMKFSG